MNFSIVLCLITDVAIIVYVLIVITSFLMIQIYSTNTKQTNINYAFILY
nr:MAG TPA: hypothetical protein [Caudoviricetes sp.]